MQENQLQFRVSSALKDLVGKDLITNDFIAIFELVKNSYDAYATKVEITFEQDRIIIADNGKGMTLEDIKSKWLFVGFSAKKDGSEDDDKQSSYRDNIKRHYAGAKGIGRFSCDRLGENLTLTTKSKSSTNTETIYVNWTDFDIDQSKEFKDIQLRHISTNKKINFPNSRESGTILEITTLHSLWDRPKIIQLKAQLEKLINPFSETTDFEIELISKDNGKADEDYLKSKTLSDGSIEPSAERNTVNGIIKNSILDVLQLKTTQVALILKDGEISTTINDRGTKIFQIKETNREFDSLQNVTIYLYYLNRAAKYNFSLRMGLQPVQYGSIFLFRNGFRIMPFGDVGDDSWGLDQRAQQGRSRFIGTRDLFGRVDVVTSKIDDLKEVSSRDGGLIKTEASDQLFKLFDTVHRHLERYVTGVLWGEAFLRKEYFENETIALAKRKELLDAERDSEDTDYILHSSIGSKIDFVQLIKTLTKNKNIEVVYYNKDLANILSDPFLTGNVKPQFIEDLEKIAEETNDDKLLFSIDEARRKIAELEKEKELAEQKAFDEELKRIAAEEKARKAEIAKELAELKRAEEEEAKKQAQLQAKEAELKRREEEIKRKEVEQKRKEEEEKRKKAEEEKEKSEKKLEKKIEQLKIVTSLSSQDLEAVTNLHHQTNVTADNIKTMITRFSRKLKKNESVPYETVIEFLDDISLENSKIISFSRFGIKKIFDDFTTKESYNVVEFLKNYIEKIAKQFGDSRLKIEFENALKNSFYTEFAPIDISVIVDNMISNAKKANANILLVKTSDNNDSLTISFTSNKPFNKEISNFTDLFERGFSTTKSTGVGLYHIKNIIEENGWSIKAQEINSNAQFIIAIKK